MKTINKQSDNMGGVIRVWAVPPEDVTLSAGQLTINSTTNLVSIYSKEDAAGFNEDLKEAFQGKALNTELSLIVPCDNADTSEIIAEMERKSKYLVIYQDGNERFKLAGTVDVPLRFSAKAATGTAAAALNHYAVKFSGLQKQRAIFITNPF